MNGTTFEAAAVPMWTAVSGEPVNEIRRTPGCRVSAAPASSPIPWTTLKTPAGKSASATRSQRSEHESGDHSAGFSTTVHPAASAGAVFQVESMNGAFHGVITTAGPLGIRTTRLRVPFDSHIRSSCATARSAYARKFRAPRAITRARSERRSIAMSAHSTAASRSTFASIRSARRWRCAARPSGPSACPARKRLRRRRDGELRLALAASCDLRDRLGVDRREVDERLGARNALAADEVVGRDVDAGNLDAPSRS